MDLDALQCGLRCARKTWRELEKNSPERRSKFIERLAQAKAEAGNSSFATELRKMNLEEAERSTARRIRAVTGKRSGHCATVFRSRQRDTFGNKNSPLVLDTKELQEEQFLSDYERRLRLAEGRGLMVVPYVYDFGYLGVTRSAQAVLEGIYVPPPEATDFARAWFHQLQYKDQAQPCWEADITWQEFDHCWKCVREQTSPGYSGLFANLFKKTLDNPYISEFDYQMLRYPFMTGYSPSRWHIGVDAVIPKKVDNDFIQDSRTILLFELDCNVMNKIFAKKLMNGAKRWGTLTPENYGSQKDLSSEEQSLNKRLFFDLALLERRPAIDEAVDLMSCYDLVGHSACSLSMQSQGAPAAPVVSILTTVQDMVHHCQTSYGISSEVFGGDVWSMPQHPPLSGLGQGSGT